ncbi:MAG: ferrous iron transport protein A [Alphaproteobacteria bacterium]|jgi:ferrous iron transport protein A
MTLWEMPKRTSAVVDKLDDKLTQSIKTRLNEMGFVTGELLTCMKRSPFGGPLVVQIQDCVYSLDHQLAKNICVNRHS